MARQYIFDSILNVKSHLLAVCHALRENRRNFDKVALLTLFLLTLVLHHSALWGYWRWDDGTHLLHALQYPWYELLFNPEVMRSVAGNQIAPWNLLVYKVNIFLFGENVHYYYAHHIFSLWSAAAGVYILLRQWLSIERSFFAASFLLMGVPAFQMAQQLMVGHYFDGLWIVCLGLSLHIHAVRTDLGRREKFFFMLTSTVLYTVACFCKEIYVPWFVLWMVVPWALAPARMYWGRWSVVLLHGLPTLCVAIGYIFWRWMIFAGSGRSLPDHAIFHVWSSLADIFPSMWGRGTAGVVAFLLVSILVISVRWTLRTALLTATILLVAFAPLGFVAVLSPDWLMHTRYLWLPWLVLCIAWVLPWGMHWRRLQGVAALLFVALVAWQVNLQRPIDQQREALFDAHYRMVLEAPAGVSAWLPGEINGPGYLAYVTYGAAAAWEGLFHRRLVVPALLQESHSTDKSTHNAVRVWHAACQCFESPSVLSATDLAKAWKPHITEYLSPFPVSGLPLRTADRYVGPTPVVRREGNKLYVSGATPTQGRGRVVYFTGFRGWPRLDILPSEPVAPSLNQPPSRAFRVSLEFLNASEAEQAENMLCVIFLSYEHPESIEVLDASAPTSTCSRLLTPWALRNSLPPAPL